MSISLVIWVIAALSWLGYALYVIRAVHRDDVDHSAIRRPQAAEHPAGEGAGRFSTVWEVHARPPRRRPERRDDLTPAASRTSHRVTGRR